MSYSEGLAEGVKTYADRFEQREEIREALDSEQTDARRERWENMLREARRLQAEATIVLERVVVEIAATIGESAE